MVSKACIKVSEWLLQNADISQTLRDMRMKPLDGNQLEASGEVLVRIQEEDKENSS